MKPTSEAQLVYVVEDWLNRQGYETRLELQWRPGARTDLVGRQRKEYVAVEVKVRNWRRAFEQALCQGKAFDKVYVAATYRAKSPALDEILTDSCPWTNWIGVLGIDGEQVVVLREPSTKPGRLSMYYRAIVALQFMASTRAGQVPFCPRSTTQPARL